MSSARAATPKLIQLRPQCPTKQPSINHEILSSLAEADAQYYLQLAGMESATAT